MIDAADVWVLVCPGSSGSLGVGIHSRKPGHAFISILAETAVDPRLRVEPVGGDAFDGGFQQGGDPAFAMGVGRRG